MIREAIKGLFIGFGMVAAFIIVAEWDSIEARLGK